MIEVGIIGGGLIAQVEHLPNLLNLPALFHVGGLADPSAKVRDHIERRWGVATFATAEALMAEKLDAVLIATPDSYHADLAVAALERGLHVFCEKPLCYVPEDADRVAAARDKAKRVMQVGYMKRFDPSWRLLRDFVVGAGKRLRMVSVEVNDPDSWPFVAHRDYVTGNDVPVDLIAANNKRRAEQIGRALGRPPSLVEIKGFSGPYSSSMVHDVNVVHGLLDAMGLETGEIAGAAVYARGSGGQGTIRLTPGDGLWTVFHLAVPKLADYLERVTLYFDDLIYELAFPSPYLNHQPTVLTEKRSNGHHAETVVHRASYGEAFVEELRAWHAAIAEGAISLNTVEEARRDMVLIGKLGRKAFGIAAV
jgi:predicted dehydrogenase